MAWVPRSASPHEDTVLFGDDQGYVNLLTICAKDLTVKNTKGEKRYTANFAIEPKKLSVWVHCMNIYVLIHYQTGRW